MSKKYMAIAALMLCFAAQVSAQTVMVENTGRAAVSNYVPEMGFTVDVNVGYVLGLGDAHNYANATPLPSYHIGLGYFLDKHWRVGLSYQKSYLQEDMGFRKFNNGYYSIYGHAVRNVDFDNVMINGDYTFPVSRWVRPYVGLSIGMGSVKMYTDVAGRFTMEDSKWMFTVAPEAGLRGYFDRHMTVGYRASIAYSRAFGDLETTDGAISSPSYLRIGVGAFVKFL